MNKWSFSLLEQPTKNPHEPSKIKKKTGVAYNNPKSARSKACSRWGWWWKHRPLELCSPWVEDATFPACIVQAVFPWSSAVSVASCIRNKASNCVPKGVRKETTIQTVGKRWQTVGTVSLYLFGHRYKWSPFNQRAVWLFDACWTCPWCCSPSLGAFLQPIHRLWWCNWQANWKGFIWKSFKWND